MARTQARVWTLACLVVIGATALRAQAPQAAGRRTPASLPDGPGKDAVVATCGSCHGVNAIAGAAGYSRTAWRDLIATMVALPPDREDAITTYLARHFPPRPGRAPELIAGDVTVTFKEWVVPTLGQRSRDPLQMADGTIWWNGQFISLVGRLNPTTGEMKEYRLDPASKPHSIVADAAGNIWYTGNGNATIGKLVPATGEITVYQMPDPAARDPHTAIFVDDGTLFFTLQQSNMVGRLRPETGDITVITLPTPRALPYGLKADSQGVVWVSYNGAGKIARIDPVTMAVREYLLPDPATRSRRLAITSDDMVWFVNSSLGRLGRLNPTTGEVREWPSPSGSRSHPYAIEVIDDVIWYNESGQRPDALVRFDPKTERFQSWAIPSGVGIIRHMRKTPDGNLAIHQSSTNRVGLAIIGKRGSERER